MAEQFSMPSMFDTRYAMDRQMELDAQRAGQVGGGGKRYGMYYNSSLLGDRDNASLMSLTGMMGGQGDPRMAKQQAIDTIMQQFPSPETAEDFKAISNALRQQGLYEEADRAMSMATDIIASQPKADKPATAIQLFNEAVRGGYTGTFYEYQIDLKAAGAPSTTMLPTPAKGFQYEQDKNGNWIAKIIPGGSADLEKQEVDRAKIQSQINKQNDASVVLSNVSLVRDAIKNPATFFGIEVGATGWGSLLKDIPASQAKGVEGMIKTMKGNIGFAKLQAMREASPTGGALGQVSNIELELLTGVIGSLDQAQSDEDLLRVLDQIEYTYNIIVHGQATAPNTTETTETETTEPVDPLDPLGVL